MTTVAAPTPAPPREASYWEVSARPLVSLAFVVPMLVLYEVGVIALGPAAVRNGADAWMRDWLELLGFGQYFFLPLLTCGMLVAWHHLREYPWGFGKQVLWVMWLESTLFALILLALAYGQANWFGGTGLSILCEVPSNRGQWLAGVIGYFGAGIYEELLFRLLLFPLAYATFRAGKMSPNAAMITAVLLTSIIFSAAHYRLDLWLGPWHITTAQGYAFDWYSFVFRFLAGSFFATLFHFRGFGIAAGTHALYDIFAVLF